MMRLRAIAFLSALLVTLALAPAAGASKPVRERVPAPPERLFPAQSEFCEFPVLGRIEGDEIQTTFFDRARDAVKLLAVFPNQTLTLTNLQTWKTITLVNAGSYQARAKRDGSVEISITGRGPLPNDVVGQPGLWYLNGGRVLVTLDAEGNVTSVTVSGNVVNLCDQLAAAS